MPASAEEPRGAGPIRMRAQGGAFEVSFARFAMAPLIPALPTFAK